MKNYNDSGTVHYNAATDQSYVERPLSFLYRNHRFEYTLKLPLEMLPALKTEHFDQAIIVAKRTIDTVAVNMMKKGDFRLDHIFRCAEAISFAALLEHLYNEFHIHQAKVGDEVWATPQQMQDVGPAPEDDVKFLN